MIPFRIVQNPPLRPPAAIVLFLVGADDDARLRQALPGWAILATDKAPLSPTSTEVLAAVRKLPQVDAEVPVYLAGFSAGCQSVRSLILGGFAWAGVAAFDGTHGNFPKPLDMQVEPWKRYADLARKGEAKAIFTCTSMGYTEKLRDDPSTPALEHPFMATKHMLVLILGQELVPGQPLQEGNLHAEAFASADIDKDAHIRQQNVVMPALLAQCWSAGGDGPKELVDTILTPFRAVVDMVSDALRGVSVFSDAAIPLRRRLALWALVEVRHAVKEDPLGSNDGPRIRDYDKTPFIRRNAGGKERPIKAPKSPWCAKAACAGLAAVALEGDKLPRFRVSGVELENDAKEDKTWIPASDIMTEVNSGLDPEGFLCILSRDNPNVTGDEWQRHVAILITKPDQAGVFTTAAGNESDKWKVTTRNVKDKDVLGLVRIG